MAEILMSRNDKLLRWLMWRANRRGGKKDPESCVREGQRWCGHTWPGCDERSANERVVERQTSERKIVMQTLTSDSIPQARHFKFNVSYDRRTITGKSFMNDIAEQLRWMWP